MKKISLVNNERGIFLIGALLTTVMFMIIALALAEYGLAHYQSARRNYLSLQTLGVAEAGADEFMRQLHISSAYTGTPTEETLFDDTTLKIRGTFHTSIASGSLSNEKIVTSIGRVYSYATGTNRLLLARKVKLTIRGTTVFHYGVQTGSGPLYLFGNSGFTGEVYSNSNIYIQDNAVNIAGKFTAVKGAPWPANECAVEGGPGARLPGSEIHVQDDAQPGSAAVCIDTTGPPASTIIEDNPLPADFPTIDKDYILGKLTANNNCDTIDDDQLIGPGELYEIKNSAYPDQGSTPKSPDIFCRDNTLNPYSNLINTTDKAAKLKRNEAYTLKGDAYIRGDLHAEGNTIKSDCPSSFDIYGRKDVYLLIEGRLNIDGNGTAIVPPVNCKNADNTDAKVIVVSYSDFGPITNRTDDSNAIPNLCGVYDYNCIRTYDNSINKVSAIDIKGNALSLNGNFLAPNGSLRFKGTGGLGSLAAQSIVMNGGNVTIFIGVDPALPNPNLWSITSYQLHSGG